MNTDFCGAFDLLREYVPSRLLETWGTSLKRCTIVVEGLLPLAPLVSLHLMLNKSIPRVHSVSLLSSLSSPLVFSSFVLVKTECSLLQCKDPTHQSHLPSMIQLRRICLSCLAVLSTFSSTTIQSLEKNLTF